MNEGASRALIGLKMSRDPSAHTHASKYADDSRVKI